MTNEIKVGDALELSTDINVITAEISAYQRVAGEAIFEIGRRLKYVKENDLAHGEFGEWTESIGMDARRASEFITVFEQLAGEDFRTYGKMGMNALYLIATMPEESRTESHTIPSTGEEKSVDEMTVRELREVKRELKKTQEERDAERKEREQAEQAKLQAEQRVEQAQRSEEIAVQRLEEVEGREPAIEIRTEYVEVADEVTQEKIKRYEELFGDVSMYDGQTTRVTNGDAITYTVFEFGKEVREFIEKFGHLTHFAREFNEMIDEGKEEYKKSINDMRRFLTAIERNLDEVEATIIEG